MLWTETVYSDGYSLYIYNLFKAGLYVIDDLHQFGRTPGSQMPNNEFWLVKRKPTALWFRTA